MADLPDWNDRTVKRHISRTIEKPTLPDSRGRALILPGAEATEVRELVDMGYNPGLITGVERDPEIALNLVRQYGDYFNIVYGDIFFLANNIFSRSQYTYMHLDLCSQAGVEVLYRINSMLDLLDDSARFRLTFSYDRKPQSEFDEERAYVSDLIAFGEYLMDETGDQSLTESLVKLEIMKDDFVIPQIVSVLCYLLFDASKPRDLWNYVENRTIPAISSRKVTRLQNLVYNDGAAMGTFWLDMAAQEEILVAQPLKAYTALACVLSVLEPSARLRSRSFTVGNNNG